MVHLITFQVSPPLYKHFQWALLRNGYVRKIQGISEMFHAVCQVIPKIYTWEIWSVYIRQQLPLCTQVCFSLFILWGQLFFWPVSLPWDVKISPDTKAAETGSDIMATTIKSLPPADITLHRLLTPLRWDHFQHFLNSLVCDEDRNGLSYFHAVQLKY